MTDRIRITAAREVDIPRPRATTSTLRLMFSVALWAVAVITAAACLGTALHIAGSFGVPS